MAPSEMEITTYKVEVKIKNKPKFIIFFYKLMANGINFYIF